MTMPIKYPNRCLKDLFGYCGKGKVGTEMNSPNKEVSYVGTFGECLSSPESCKDYVNTKIVNPYCPELEKTKLRKVKTEA
jgi:hypothetical protein